MRNFKWEVSKRRMAKRSQKVKETQTTLKYAGYTVIGILTIIGVMDIRTFLLRVMGL